MFLDRNMCRVSIIWPGALRPRHENRQLEKAQINNQIAMNYPLTTNHPVKRRNPVSGENYPVASNSPASANIHNSTTSYWTRPCEPSSQPPNRPSTERPQQKNHSLKRTISRPAIRLLPNCPACVPSRRYTCENHPVKTFDRTSPTRFPHSNSTSRKTLFVACG